MVNQDENARGFFAERLVVSANSSGLVEVFLEAGEFARRLSSRSDLHWMRWFQVWAGRRTKKGFGGFASAVPPAARTFCTTEVNDDSYVDLAVSASGLVGPILRDARNPPASEASITICAGFYTVGRRTKTTPCWSSISVSVKWSGDSGAAWAKSIERDWDAEAPALWMRSADVLDAQIGAMYEGSFCNGRRPPGSIQQPGYAHILSSGVPVKELDGLSVVERGGDRGCFVSLSRVRAVDLPDAWRDVARD